MGPQVEVEGEAFVTYFALVRLFSSVHKIVALQLRIVEKLLVANVTGKHPFSVSDLVFSERTVVGKCLHAVFNLACDLLECLFDLTLKSLMQRGQCHFPLRD